jgi:myo-inositol-1(or 4)-monophosphatase
LTTPAVLVLDIAMNKTPSTADLSLYLETAFAACDGAKEILNRYFGNLRKVDEKFQAGLVSEADKESELFIDNLIRSRLPTHDILGEESGLSYGLGHVTSNQTLPQENATVPAHKSGFQWLIDPLDGTTNYVHQFPFFCISIGLQFENELIMGVVDAPKLGVRYHAVKGGGAFVNGDPIHASKRKEIKDALFATGFTSHDPELDDQVKLFAEVIRQSRGVRRAGSAALDMCYVAQGIFDGYWEKNLQPWDTAAGAIIAREAGGIVTNFEGDFFYPTMNSVFCSSPLMHPQFMNIRSKMR